MERVTDMGGLFFRSDNPGELAVWYARHLGIDPSPDTYDTPSWWRQPGPTVFTGMSTDFEHFGPEQSWSINFRVGDLDAMVRQLTAAGIEVEVEPGTYPNGRLASLKDPENNVPHRGSQLALTWPARSKSWSPADPCSNFQGSPDPGSRLSHRSETPVDRAGGTHAVANPAAGHTLS